MSGKRERIVEAAACLIHRKGYQGTTLDDVLRASKVAKGNFYYYFRSKEELGFAVLARYERVLAERLGRLLECRDLPPLGRIEAILDSNVENVLRATCGEDCRAGNLHHGCPIANLAVELSDVHEGFRQKLEAAFARMQSAIEGLLREHLGGNARGDEPARIAAFVIAGLEGGILLAKLRKDPGVLQGTVEQIKEHLRVVVSRVAAEGNAIQARA